MKKILRKPWLIALILIFAAAGLLTVACLSLRVADGVTLGGLPVGGRNLLQAWQVIRDAEKETVGNTPLVVELPDETLHIDPKEMGLKIHKLRAVADAYMAGHETEQKKKELPLSGYLILDESKIRELLADYAARYDTVLTQPSWKLRGQVPDLNTGTYDPNGPGQTVELTLGLPDRHLDADTAFAQILAAYDWGLAGLKKLRLEVEPEKLPEQPDLEEIYKTCTLSGKDDGLNMQTYEIDHGTFGYHFDMKKAQDMIDQADYGDVVSIPMEVFEPEIYGERVYFRDVLGDCETKHSADENRNVNLALVCQFLDGLVIQPGEEFSYNMAVGERTEERGFKPATVFAGSHKAKDFGGGVCQGSTTLYNCLLEADMDVLERHGHGALVTYIPLGLDAAVNWATKTDLRFKNNSHFPVKIQAEVSDGYMKMKLLGTDEKDYYIEMEAKSYKEGDYYYAGSYKCKYDKVTQQLISRDRVAFSSYIADLPAG